MPRSSGELYRICKQEWYKHKYGGIYIIIVYGGKNRRYGVSNVKTINLSTSFSADLGVRKGSFNAITGKFTKLQLSKLPQFTIL
mgnify:CR=1 FL=1